MSSQTQHSRLFLLAVVLSVGAGLAWFVGVVWTFAIVRGVVQQSFPSLPFDEAPLVRNTLITRDGTPLVAETRHAPPTLAYYALDGSLLQDGASTGKLDGTILPGPLPERPFRGLTWEQRIVRFRRDFDSSTMQWYFLHDGHFDGSGYFVGYDIPTRLPVQYIGRSGFGDQEPPAEERFRVNGRFLAAGRAILRPGNEWSASKDGAGLLTKDGLVEIDMKKRTVKTLCAEPDIVSANLLNTQSLIAGPHPNDTTTWLGILVRTSDQIRTLGVDGKLLRSYPLPEAVRQADFAWYEFPDARALIRELPNGGQLYWLDASGKIVRHESVDLSVRLPPHRETFYNVLKVAGGLALPSPGTLAGMGLWNWVFWQPAPMNLRGVLAELWPMIAAMCLVSTILALLTLRRHRKFGLTWTWLWVGSVLVFGIPAYLGYLVHREWPARLACPHCGRLAPRDRPACFACGQMFPAPAPTGVEIFA